MNVRKWLLLYIILFLNARVFRRFLIFHKNKNTPAWEFYGGRWGTWTSDLVIISDAL